ncbi:MAG: hypothetical protein GY782_08510 [Gammaproteobacteria bacterium]|nr:hypothetical protein [Gammaproteobacteria bacterium]
MDKIITIAKDFGEIITAGLAIISGCIAGVWSVRLKIAKHEVLIQEMHGDIKEIKRYILKLFEPK